MKRISNNKIISVAILATIMGLFAGIAGELIAREYMFRDLYGLPFGSEFNLSHTGLNSPNLVIKDAKNITVEQEEKVKETIRSSSQRMVGIFEKKDSPTSSEDVSLDVERSYKMKDSLAPGIIVTSDGWIMAENFAPDLDEELWADRYVVITEDKEVYDIEEVELVEDSILFLRLKEAEGLPVSQLAEEENIGIGDMALALEWEDKGYLTTVVEKERSEELVRSSDTFSEKIRIANNLDDHFRSAFLFNLKGELVGIHNNEDRLGSVNNYRAYINNLLEKEGRELPSLGVNYLNLEDLVRDTEGREKGALIHPDTTGVAIEEGSAADKAGLQQGDIITSINNVDVEAPDHTLNYLVQKHSAGDTLTITYIRDGEEHTQTAKLQGVEY